MDPATTQIYTYGHTLSLHDALPICAVVRAVRALRHLPGLTAARIGAVLFAGMVVGACNPAPSQPAEPAHEKHLTPRLIAQRIMYCDDGSRADVDFIDDGLKMAVTWLPKGRTEILHAQRRSEEHTSELQSLMRISYAVFCLKKKKN